jgi:hypothetical protein
MADWDDVRRIALALPETTEGSSRGLTAWRVRDKQFAWERPLRRKEIEELGERAPEGPILGVWVEDLGAKEATLADDPRVYFTTSHFDGYAAVLIRLDEIGVAELREALTESWFARAPKRLARELADHRDLPNT